MDSSGEGRGEGGRVMKRREAEKKGRNGEEEREGEREGGG